MSLLWNSLRQASQILWHSVSPLSKAVSSLQVPAVITRLSTSAVAASQSYDPYPKFEETPDVYRRPYLDRRHGYKYKYFDGGLLPRPKGEWEDKPVRGLPEFKPKNAWSEKRALFGQNDYIDILGDGTVHPWQLMRGPAYLRGFRGNEFQRLIRQLQFEGPMLREVYPTKYHEICKRVFFQYKRLNRRKHAPFWSGKGSGKRSRILNIKNRF